MPQEQSGKSVKRLEIKKAPYCFWRFCLKVAASRRDWRYKEAAHHRKCGSAAPLDTKIY